MPDARSAHVELCYDQLMEQAKALGLVGIKELLQTSERLGVRLPLKIVFRERVPASCTGAPDTVILDVSLREDQFLTATARANDTQEAFS